MLMSTAEAEAPPRPRALSEWLSRPQVRRLLGVGEIVLDRLVEEKRITVRDIPGARLMFSRSSVEEFLRRCTKEAERPDVA
jgi:hypothetical protein